MSSYKQACVCRGKALALTKDLENAREEAASCRLQAMVLRRHLRAASRLTVPEREELSIDILGWMKEAERFDGRAIRTEWNLMRVPTVADCHICCGTGVVVGNGAASVGGMGRGRTV